uniref:Uncharacterized protein n=2 Tax=Anopheles atroparvus TaxID=41427 RepID=A0A182JI50_ANOAO
MQRLVKTRPRDTDNYRHLFGAKMALVKDSATFFQHGNSAQFEYVLGLYKQALKLKAETRGNDRKAEKLMRLEEWYQNELPKLIKKRGRDAHLLHEELVQTMEWKQTRGKFYPQLSYLIKINTPRAVVMETKKAFRKLPNLEQALNALSNLKGVGITMASALLAAAAPESAPFMADECLMAIPDIEGIDYTAKEYLKFVKHIQQTMERLNLEVESNGAAGDPATDDSISAPDETADAATSANSNGAAADTSAATGSTTTTPTEDAPAEPTTPAASKAKGAEAANGTAETKPKKWSAHSVELALWTYYVLFDHRPELLRGIPGTNNGVAAAQNGDANEGDEEEEVEEEEAGDEDENENGTAEDEGDNDENSRNAVMESSESESNEAGGGGTDGGGGLVVPNGKTEAPLAAAGEPSKDATDSGTDAVTPEVTKESAATPAEQTNNGTALDAGVTHLASSAEEGAPKASGESLGPEPANASLCVTSTAADHDMAHISDSDSQPNNVSSNGSNKRALCCDDNGEDKPELSAPKLIKL